MAKQLGLHQIKGKVGEYSYYKQTGVSGGLMRSINQGLSARVKNDEAFSNTRLNNQEFGAAANVAALLGQCVTPKFRPMILPFSQSKMAKEILKVAREHTANWGQRVVSSDDTARLCEILSAMSKRDFTEFASISIARTSASVAAVSGSISTDQATLMSSLGISGISLVVTQFDIATGQWIPLAQEMSTGYLYRKESVRPFDESDIEPDEAQSNSKDMDVTAFVPEANHAGHQIVVAVLLPLRTINSVSHILQEYCSFIALPLPAAA